MDPDNECSTLLDSDIDAVYADVLLISDEDPDKSAALDDLGDRFRDRFQQSGDIADIDKAISAQDVATQLMTDDHPDKATFLNNLGVSYLSRFQHLDELADLDKAISAQKDAVALVSDDHPDKATFLETLGISWHSRFEHSGDIADLDEAIAAQNDAVELTPDDHPDKATLLNSLGTSWKNRFDCLGDMVDLDNAVSVYGDALHLAADDHSERPNFLSCFGLALQSRFGLSGDIEDLENAISVQKTAVELTRNGHPNEFIFLGNLGISVHQHFDQIGDIATLNKAMTLLNDAVELAPDDHSSKIIFLSSLGVTFQSYFMRLGDIAYLDKAISVQSDIVQLLPDGYEDRATYLHNLASTLYVHFKHLGDLADLDKAISLQNDAVEVTPDHDTDKALYLNNLGLYLQNRFRRLGDKADIDKAILVQNDAIQQTPDGHPGMPGRLSNLGLFLQSYFEDYEDITELDKAILVLDKAVKLTPDGHPEKTSHMNNLGTSLHSRFKFLGDITDLNRAILVQTEAIQLTPDGHLYKSNCLNNLGTSLWRHFDSTGDIANLDKAISIQTNAVQLTPVGHPEQPLYLNELGSFLWSRFKQLGNDIDAKNAIIQFSSATCSSSGPARVRLSGAIKWAEYASTISASSLEAYSYVIKLLPQVAWLGLSIEKRHNELAEIGNVVHDAASAAILSGEYVTALEWLEQGHSIVWGQLLNLRTPVDRLREKEPALANQLAQVSAQLENTSTQGPGVDLNTQMSMEDIGQHHRDLAAQWDRLVDSARNVLGFEDFLQPKKLSQLKFAAQSGPVVVINIHKKHCDALVLKKDMDSVIHIPLNSFSYSQAKELQHMLEQVLRTAGLHARGERHAGRASKHRDDGSIFNKILSELWLKVVEPVLKALSFEISQELDPPHLWWCPTGPLAFLPIHAAGLYDKSELGYKVFDFVTSSYTPTLTALLESSHLSRDTKNFHLLAIAQPLTPGASPLPSTKEELVQIQQLAGANPMTCLEGAAATRKSVIASMKNSAWVHMACHGAQNVNEPTSSGLLLQDGSLKLSEIIRMSLPNADFAFLSACQTATGDQSLSEEAVHLAAGMLLAGYHGVIATMWSIKDEIAPVVANKVYARLFKDQQPDSSQAAHALHNAVRHLREQNAPFLSWVPFIHIGA